MNPSIAIDWRPRLEPLEPCALLARDETARAVARRLLASTDERLARLKGGVNEDGLVITGPAEHLPWAPGVLYFGSEPGALSVLFPTALEPGIPAALLDRAIVRQFPRAPMLIVPDPETIIPLDTIRPLERKRIEDWLNDLKTESPFPPVQTSLEG